MNGGAAFFEAGRVVSLTDVDLVTMTISTADASQTVDDVTSGQPLRHLPLKLDDGAAVSASGAWVQDEFAIGFFLDPEPTLANYQLAAAANFT